MDFFGEEKKEKKKRGEMILQSLWMLFILSACTLRRKFQYCLKLYVTFLFDYYGPFAAGTLCVSIMAFYWPRVDINKQVYSH